MSNESRQTHDGPIKLSRRFLEGARAAGAISVTYHYSDQFRSVEYSVPYVHFETGKHISRYRLNAEHAKVIERSHRYVIRLGRPVILSRHLPAFKKREPKLTGQIMAGLNRSGVFDLYMVPVYGPFQTDGVISFGFAETIDHTNKELLRRLEGLATAHHNQMVRHFGERRTDIDLSKRENEVLGWIAKGKSSTDIATILAISKASVDTYTRRIFEKMGVNDRVSAAVSGVVSGLVKPG
jgi:DNA-binding CsgD family transcriptional regulator